jgi:hypothetical protein
MITYMISLRGLEGFLLDLGGLQAHTVDPRKGLNHFIIPLMEKVKGEHHDRCHLIPCSFSTLSGLKQYVWLEQLRVVKSIQGLFDGPAISDEKGRVLNSSTIFQGMHKILVELLLSKRGLFPTTIIDKDDIVANYHVF